MAAKSLVAGLTLIFAGLGLSSATLAGPPGMSSHASGWNMSFNECMRRASAGLRENGFEVQVHQTAAGGLLGDYNAQIICAPKQVIVVVVAGPEANKADEYVKSIQQTLLAFSGQRR